MGKGTRGTTRISAGNRRRVQVRKERKDAFNEAKKQIFLDHLAACCTVEAAAAAAGVSVNTVNYHRRTDPVFAEAFEQALEISYDTLDARMVARAARGGNYVPGDTIVPGPDAMDIQLGLHLLSLRRRPPGRRTGRAGPAPRRASEKEVTESILAKLDVLDRRLKLKRAEVRKLKTRKDVAAARGQARRAERTKRAVTRDQRALVRAIRRLARALARGAALGRRAADHAREKDAERILAGLGA